jgi:hypothetical protein
MGAQVYSRLSAAQWKGQDAVRNLVLRRGSNEINTNCSVTARSLCASASNNIVMAVEADKSTSDAAGTGLDPDDKDLAPEDKAEKEGRKACKADLCRAFHAKETAGKDIACHVIKSWRKESLVKLVGKLKVTWPYGGVHCDLDLSAKRADLGKALAEPKVEAALDKHTVTCTIAGEKSADTEFKFELAPRVKFENGKATEAKACISGFASTKASTRSIAFWQMLAEEIVVSVVIAVDQLIKSPTALCDLAGILAGTLIISRLSRLLAAAADLVTVRAITACLALAKKLFITHHWPIRVRISAMCHVSIVVGDANHQARGLRDRVREFYNQRCALFHSLTPPERWRLREPRYWDQPRPC